MSEESEDFDRQFRDEVYAHKLERANDIILEQRLESNKEMASWLDDKEEQEAVNNGNV